MLTKKNHVKANQQFIANNKPPLVRLKTISKLITWQRLHKTAVAIVMNRIFSWNYSRLFYYIDINGVNSAKRRHK